MRSLVCAATVVTACTAASPASRPQDTPRCWFRNLGAGTTETFTAFGVRGELTIAASFSEPTDVGGRMITSAGARDALVARYDRDGRLLWSRVLGGASDEIVGALAIDGHDDAVVTASVGVADADARAGASPTGCMVAKLAGNDGHVLWSTLVQGTGYQLCRGIAASDLGDVYVAAAFDDQVALGGGLASRGKHDIWLAAFASIDGARRWVRQIGGGGNEIVRTLAVDTGHDVLLGGQFGGEVPPADGVIDLGTGPLRSAGDFDGLLAKFTAAAGTPIWARGFGDVGFDLVKSIAVDRHGDVFISGAWMRPQSFHDEIPILAGVMDGTIARYARDGTLRWRYVFTGGGSQAHHVSLDASGRIWIAGHFNGTVDLGGGRVLHSAEESAAYAAAFSPAGVPLYAALIGSPAAHYAHAIAAGPDGAIAVGVTFSGSGRFCGKEVASGGDAMLIMVMTPVVP
jgi:hypothetical protein